MAESHSFWEHLEELRGSLIKMIVAAVACSIVAFVLKDEVFGVILAPQSCDFITYRCIEELSGDAWSDSLMSVQLINTGLAAQFLIHVKVSLFVGLLLSMPLLVYWTFCFIAPALYTTEKSFTARLMVYGTLMFLLGTALSYFLIFPLTFKFLGNYQVSSIVANTVTIESYVDTFFTISLSMGIVFEIPVVCWFLGRMGFISSELMKRYRRHMIVGILIAAAIITPTSDVFTLLLVALPMMLLYELSIIIVKLSSKQVCTS